MEQWYKCPKCNLEILYGLKECPACKTGLGWIGNTRGTVPYLSRSFTIEVKGESHHNDDGASRQDIIRQCKPGEPVNLIHEPVKQDENVVKVCRLNGQQIGYIPKYASAEFAIVINRGIKQDAEIAEIRDGEFTGCWLKITRYADDLTWDEKAKLRTDEDSETIIVKPEQIPAPPKKKTSGCIVVLIAIVVFVGLIYAVSSASNALPKPQTTPSVASTQPSQTTVPIATYSKPLLSAAETQYAYEIVDSTAKIGNSFDSIHELLATPQLADSTWQVKLGARLGLLRLWIRNAKGIVAPASMVQIQAKYIEALDHYFQFTDLLDKAMKTLDVKYINPAGSELDAGNNCIGQATKLLQDFKNAHSY